MKAQGWAVVQGDNLLVPTVSETRRAALVNWLCVYPTPPMRLSNTTTDHQIEALWAGLGAVARAELVRVEIAIVGNA